ncbi:MAG TPA: RNA polymerase sigma factor [Pirellulales bacterium]|jgi:RNA polymerase sigma-70 factor (ECF subfamily)
MCQARDQQSDADIVSRVRGGDSEAFGTLVARYRGALLRVAQSRLGRLDWAEDVAQETLLAAFKWCGSYDPKYSFRTWLWTILLNQCSAHYQRRMRREETASEFCGERARTAEQADDNTPLAALLSEERTAQLESLLLEISAVQADALRLRFFGGLKFQEIADAMQCSLNTAKNRVRWGLTKLAKLIEPSQTGASGRSNTDGEQER